LFPSNHLGIISLSGKRTRIHTLVMIPHLMPQLMQPAHHRFIEALRNDTKKVSCRYTKLMLGKTRHQGITGQPVNIMPKYYHPFSRVFDKPFKSLETKTTLQQGGQ
jgi:hypothetical protein